MYRSFTVSTVSTVSERLYNNYLSHLHIYSLNDMLNVHMVNFCHIKVILRFPSELQVHLYLNLFQCLLLVVPDNIYNRSVPVLLGANILSKFLNLCIDMEKDFFRFLIYTLHGIHHSEVRFFRRDNFVKTTGL